MKKTVNIFLGSVMCLSLAACSSGTAQENAEDTVVPLPVAAVHGGEQALALVQGKIAGKGLRQLGRIQILYRVFLQQMRLDRQVFVKALDGGDLSGAGRGGNAVFGVMAALVLDAVPAQEGQVFVDLGERHGLYELQIDIVEGDTVVLNVTPKGRVSRESGVMRRLVWTIPVKAGQKVRLTMYGVDGAFELSSVKAQFIYFGVPE